ncbi:hypothetical protein [Erwinia aphidicola]|uniref:hypothetical protein n=1 Tax=Erwinia aphidicola TaxID=68334 RepID=UPI00209CCFA4|nr:hypothetical protein [Erwinia aphidicola]MCP2230174.1 hypothetical protein [Erwinia aphidicola]
MAILIPALSFLAYGAWAWWGHSPDLSENGFEVFYNISKVPLLFLATSVPLASIVNNIHRTIQTEKQINESEKKNLSDSYYTHLKHTLDMLESIEYRELALEEKTSGRKFKLQINNPVSLYKKIFNRSSYLNGAVYIPDELLTRTIEQAWADINKGLKNSNRILGKSTQTTKTDIFRQFINIYRIERSFEVISQTLNINNNKNFSRPYFKIAELSYEGIFFDDNSLMKGIEELDAVCQKIFDIINANDPSKYVDNYHFLKQNIFVDHCGFPSRENAPNFCTKQVNLHIEKWRQNGDT